MLTMKSFYSLIVLSLFFLQINAQSTFEDVITIFSQSCSSNSCHGASANHPLKLEGDPETVYNNIMNVDVLNAVAADKGNKYIVPGEPTQSFLYRKINRTLYSQDVISSDEGQSMPQAVELSDIEKETIRQWILWGAPFEGTVHNATALEDYYTNGGLDRVEPLPVPEPGTGFQIYLGTIFLEPEEEIEIMKKEFIPIGDSLEITSFEVRMNEFSHHYALSRVLDPTAITSNPGFNVVDNFLTAFDFFNNSEFVTGSQTEENNYILPENVAFRWDTDFLFLNYHIKNYSTTGVLPAEGYVNLYTQPKGTAIKEMKTRTVTFAPANVFDLVIEPTGTDTTYVLEDFDPDSEDTLQIWRLMPHTHQYGVDYDMFLRNPDGTKGEQVYEGFYNYDLDFDQGFFDYAHATYRTFDEPLLVPYAHGLILEATYNNPTNETVTFGLTTDDEMFVGYYLYTILGPEDYITNINSSENFINGIEISPNPVSDLLSISHNLNVDAKIQLIDINGRVVSQFYHYDDNLMSFNIKELNDGPYMVQIRTSDNKIWTGKFIKN